MPCNSRVVIRAKVSLEGARKIREAATQKGWPLVAGKDLKGFTIDLKGTRVIVAGDIVTFQSDSLWDSGVTQLKNLMVLFKQYGIDLTSVGQPETHRHDQPAGPWQRRAGAG